MLAGALFHYADGAEVLEHATVEFTGALKGDAVTGFGESHNC